MHLILSRTPTGSSARFVAALYGAFFSLADAASPAGSPTARTPGHHSSGLPGLLSPSASAGSPAAPGLGLGLEAAVRSRATTARDRRAACCGPVCAQSYALCRDTPATRAATAGVPAASNALTTDCQPLCQATHSQLTANRFANRCHTARRASTAALCRCAACCRAASRPSATWTPPSLLSGCRWAGWLFFCRRLVGSGWWVGWVCLQRARP
jgi:hypothetical protein